MKKAFLFFAVMGLISVQSQAQEIVLEKNVEDQYQREKGPNTSFFGQGYVAFASILNYDESTGAAINPWQSGQFIIGYRYKIKLLPFYSIGFDLGFRMNNYYLRGDKDNPYDSANPLTFKTGEKRHIFTNNGLGLELYQRINIGKRGNTLGNYLDIGIQGQWNVADVEEIVTNFDNADFVGRERLFNRRLKYVEEFSFGLSARIGIDKFVIYGNYRLSDIFKEDYQIPELPRLAVGLQYAFY